MQPKLLDILSRMEVPIENELLARYLKGELDDAGRQQVEEKLQAGDIMEQDAWEGWQQAGAKHMLQQADEINKHLEKQLYLPKRRLRQKPITNLPLTWWMFGLVLIIILLAWVIIHYLSN
ncbi:MAG TPA: hypothetical protein VK907_10645 [Phnomibacter sp.]|nr:hypothetical protein [Phnomibacter sp.]